MKLYLIAAMIGLVLPAFSGAELDASDLDASADRRGPQLERDCAAVLARESLSYEDSEVLIAQRGCCSWHQGVCGCSAGRVVCCDRTLSPSCTC